MAKTKTTPNAVPAHVADANATPWVAKYGGGYKFRPLVDDAFRAVHGIRTDAVRLGMLTGLKASYHTKGMLRAVQTAAEAVQALETGNRPARAPKPKRAPKAAVPTASDNAAAE